MTREEIINGLKMSMDLTLFDPSTGEVMEPRQLNDINRTAYEAYKGAIELLEKQPDTTTHDSNVVKKGGNDEVRTRGDCISRQAAKDIFTELYGISAIGSVFDKYEWKDICETTANELPSIQPTLYGYNIEHLEMIARVLQKEDLSPERVAEALANIGGIVAIVRDEFEETLRKAAEECTKNM